MILTALDMYVVFVLLYFSPWYIGVTAVLCALLSRMLTFARWVRMAKSAFEETFKGWKAEHNK